LSDGAIFGEKEHLRLNFGTSRNVLTRALDQMQKALRSR